VLSVSSDSSLSFELVSSSSCQEMEVIVRKHFYMYYTIYAYLFAY